METAEIIRFADPLAETAAASVLGRARNRKGPGYILGQAAYGIVPEQAIAHASAVLRCAGRIARLPEGEIIAAMRERLEGGFQSDEEAARSIADRNGFFMNERGFLAGYIAAAVREDGAGFYAWRDAALGSRRVQEEFFGGEMPTAVQAVQFAAGKSVFGHRFGRLVRLIGLGAPEGLIEGELSMCAASATAYMEAGSIIGAAPGFAKEYGIYPDGMRYIGRCERGDAELEALGQGEDPPRAAWAWRDECGESDGKLAALAGRAAARRHRAAPHGTGRRRGRMQEAGGSSPAGFCPAWLPDFLMDMDGIAVWNGAAGQYLRDGSGRIVVFKDRPDELLGMLGCQ